MEDIVDLPGRGELDFICDMGYLGDYLERSVSPLLRLQRALIVRLVLRGELVASI